MIKPVISGYLNPRWWVVEINSISQFLLHALRRYQLYTDELAKCMKKAQRIEDFSSYVMPLLFLFSARLMARSAYRQEQHPRVHTLVTRASSWWRQLLLARVRTLLWLPDDVGRRIVLLQRREDVSIYPAIAKLWLNECFFSDIPELSGELIARPNAFSGNKTRALNKT